MHSILKKIALILLIIGQAQAGWVPSWLSSALPQLSNKQTTFIGVGLGLATVGLGSYLLYKKLNSLPLITNQITNAPEFITFDDWNLDCNNLPRYIMTEKNKEPYHNPTQTPLIAADLQTALDHYFQLLQNNDNFTNNENWVNQERPEKLLTSLQKNKNNVFDPYVEKLVVKPGSVISFHGDLHGDIHSLNHYLCYLKEKRYLDQKNPFKIAEEHNDFYMVFLGDYTDRGWYGAEVIYTILRLKIENPDKVILVRGNHEDYDINKRYGFIEELEHKFGEKSIIKRMFGTNPATTLMASIQKMYETLPLALYIGSGTEDHNDFIICCHGGIEFGFDPLPLLNHESPHAYTKLGIIDREKQLEKLPQYKLLKKGFVNIGKADLNHFLPTSIFDLNTFLFIGFQWNDYEVDLTREEVPWFIELIKDRGFRIGKTFNEVMLNVQSNERNTVRGVFRAHQHSPDKNDPMMRRILNLDEFDHHCNAGVGRLWIENLPRNEDKLWNNIVCTFNVSPHTPYQMAMFNYDTYGLLTVDEQFEDWRLKVVRQEMFNQ